MRKTLLIVGAGFSGTVLTANLLRNPPPQGADIVLVERGSAMGRGVAYAARDFPYLLNVPAARLSADSANPLQFLHFAQERLPDADGEAPANVRLVRVFGEVIGLTRAASGAPLTAQLKDRAPITADIVVLALGNPPPRLPAWAEELRGHQAFREDPRHLPKTLNAGHAVLIVGNGLTMADAAAALSHQADSIPALHTMSRRGLIPKQQSVFHADAMRGNGEALLAQTHSLRKLLAACRALARDVEKLGGDWREAVAFIRNLAPALWRQLPAAERRRFVRHLYVHWDIYRHRLPPQLMARLETLRRSGKLRVNAGRIQRVVPRERRLQVSWRPRGSDETATLDVDLLVNATGPDYAIERSADPLFMSLRESGLVCADALKLGIRTGPHGACMNADGGLSRHLYYLGPMLRADHLDATAAAELRDHAEELAEHLVSERLQ
jgi:uncharacterized NAD(P)/FAD-binding protein YdhS